MKATIKSMADKHEINLYRHTIIEALHMHDNLLEFWKYIPSMNIGNFQMANFSGSVSNLILNRFKATI